MAIRKQLSPLSGQICETVNSFGQGNFTFHIRQGKVREFRNLFFVALMLIY